jgi:hypothetical protein
MASGEGLLRRAIEAHRGLKCWQTVQEIVTRIRCGGVALPLRFKFGVFKPYEARLSTRRRQLFTRKAHNHARSFPTLVWIEVDDVVMVEG